MINFSLSILSLSIAFWPSLRSYLIMVYKINLKEVISHELDYIKKLLLILLIHELFHLGRRRDNSASNCCNTRNTYDDVTGTYAYAHALWHNFTHSLPLSPSFPLYPSPSILYLLMVTTPVINNLNDPNFFFFCFLFSHFCSNLSSLLFYSSFFNSMPTFFFQ